MSTSPYNALNREFDDQLEKTAVFVPVAFHVHSPDSYDWAKRPGADRQRNDPAELRAPELLDELAKHFGMVCITDHMKSGYACALAESAQSRSDIAVFPGVELNCVGGQLGRSHIHVLAIFPPSCREIAIDRIYGISVEGSFPTERSGKEALRVESLKKLAEAIHREGGIFVLAHVDEDERGHRSRFRVTRHGTLARHETEPGSEEWKEIEQQVSQEYFEYLADLAPDAVEITNPDKRVHYASFVLPNGATRGIACVVRSDHHCVEDFERDELTTYLKVSRKDFKCVRDALLFHETRIRFKTDRPPMPSPRIVGLRLRCTTGKGLFDEATIAFNANLNCVIGPRGSGKSTVIEALRYVLGQKSALEDLAGDAGDQVNFSQIASEIQDTNLRDTLIEVVYEADATRYCLSATYDAESSVATSVFMLDGHQRPMSPQGIAAEFPVRIYSWSEIETLGRKPELQRTLLDRLVPELTPLLERRDKLRDELANNRDEADRHCRELERLLRADNGLLRRYRQYKADFEQINTDEVAGLFADLDEARERLAVLRETHNSLTELRDAFARTAEGDALHLYPTFEVRSEATRAWWEKEIEDLLDLIPLADEIADIVRDAVARIEQRLGKLNELIADQEQKTAETESTLRTTTQTAPEQEIRRDQREERKKRFDATATRRVEYEAALAELIAALEERARIADELDEIQTQIAGKREASRTVILDGLREAETNLNIDVSLEPRADREAAISHLRDSRLLTRDLFGNYRDRKWAERTFKMARPTQLARAVLARDVTKLEQEGVKLGAAGALSGEEAETLVKHFYPFADDEDAAVRTVDTAKLNSVLLLEEQPVDDVMRIMLDGRSVDRRSPGQRSSAMLPLVALSETVPLIIDQPEDNLDNRMVGQTLTKILAALKERRQIIVTTHNPNIVVSGDAEQVIVLDASQTDPHAAQVEETGSIDDSSIIAAVVSIMEGGQAAFDARKTRYALA
jgi:DNA repair ATPase RecN